MNSFSSLLLAVLLAAPPALAQGRQGTPEQGGAQPDLVVLFHAHRKGYADLDRIREVVRRTYPDADILPKEKAKGGYDDLPFSTFSTAEPADVVARLLAEIDQAWNDRTQAAGKGYDNVLFIGHSIGALYARKVYAVASLEDKPRDWVRAVDRIVLLAGMNRGWSISHHMSKTKALEWRLGLLAGKAVELAKRRPVHITRFRRGSPFITELRLQWLAMRHPEREDKTVGTATTIQLLGSKDDLVSPEDNIDLVSGGDFIYLDVPYSGHGDVIEMDDTREGLERRAVLKDAITLPTYKLRKKQVIPADQVPRPEEDVRAVVFVVHGIRDEGFWTHKIARQVIANRNEAALVELGIDEALERGIGPPTEARPPWRTASVTSKYGYFPMLSFLWPPAREEKVEWFMDQYTQALARYPNATEFFYVGHSHGTFLLARALEKYPSVRFKRVVFAGSVVRRQYDWSKYLESKQVESVLNFVATSDWVVAFFPKALQWVQWIGSAGHDGFEDAEHPRVVERRYVDGGHGAALREDAWELIARFLITGQAYPVEPWLQVPRRSWLVFLGGAVPLAVWLVIAVVLWVIYRGLERVLALLEKVPAAGRSSVVRGARGQALESPVWPKRFFRWLRTPSLESERVRTLYFVAFFAAVWLILTRF